ncbi:MAG: hypothetical protein HYU64_10875 [Armatimonadetes bacterium]|nr:hypothetical protein [Armatimonadota bacterium]
MLGALGSSNYSPGHNLSISGNGKEHSGNPISLEDKGISRKELLNEKIGEKTRNAMDKLTRFAKQNPDEASAVTGTLGFLTGSAIGAEERAKELEKELEKIRGIPKKNITSKANFEKAGAPPTEHAIIAQDAMETLADLKNFDFAWELGNRYLDLILEKKLSGTERFLLQLVRENTDSKAEHMFGEPAVGLQKCVFKILSDGADGSPDGILFRAAEEVPCIHMAEAATRRILGVLLDEISRNCSDQNEAQLAKLFQEVLANVPKEDENKFHGRGSLSSDATAVALQNVALRNLKSLAKNKTSAPLINMLPAIALECRRAISEDDWEMRCVVGRVFLDAIMKDSPSEKVTMLAQIARKFSERDWRSDEESAQAEALKKIKNILMPESERQNPSKSEKSFLEKLRSIYNKL